MKTASKPARGGARPHAGRHPKPDMRRVQLKLSAAHVALAQALGSGNVTKGIELALDRSRATHAGSR